MRLFVSINLGEELNKYLAALQDDLAKVAGGGADLALAGWKSGCHLTLFFLGEVGTDVAMQLQVELKKVESVPFELELASGLGVFADRRGFVKVVFASIDNGSSGYSALLGLQKKVASVVGRFGFVADKPFAAHITLARVKWSPVGFADAVRGLRVEKKKFVADAFYLMESELNNDGVKHREICEVGGSALGGG